MSWSINTNNKDEWSIYSSIIEDVIITFKTKEELIKFIATKDVYDGKKKAIEIFMTFPEDWVINQRRVTDREGYRAYYNWLTSIYELNTYEEQYKAIDDKLKEFMK